MAIPTKFLINALLKYNYLPRQRKDKAELPPCLHSRKFSPSLAKKLIASKHRQQGGWDNVSYRSLKFNNIPRIFAIPHPVAHALISLTITDNWNDLVYIETNHKSRIRPRKHQDGRIIIMEYDNLPTKLGKKHQLAFAKKYKVETDITNCFPSLYSHAVPWATVGFKHAKKNQKSKTWFNELDAAVRFCKRNETNGVAIGPATSNIVVESILAKVDEVLSVGHGFEFVRYIDDYTAYFETEEDAQRFLRVLGIELEKYKFLLNVRKTTISRLPEPPQEAWISELTLSMPAKKKLNIYEVASYLSHAQKLSSQLPEASVLKYAVKALISKRLPHSSRFVR